MAARVFLRDVLATENTVRTAGNGFAFQRIDDVTLRGRASPTTVYTLGSPAA